MRTPTTSNICNISLFPVSCVVSHLWTPCIYDWINGNSLLNVRMTTGVSVPGRWSIHHGQGQHVSELSNELCLVLHIQRTSLGSKIHYIVLLYYIWEYHVICKYGAVITWTWGTSLYSGGRFQIPNKSGFNIHQLYHLGVFIVIVGSTND